MGILLLIIVIVAVFVSMSIKVVSEEHRVLVLRLGRIVGVRGPGLVFKIPLIDSIFDVSLEESVPGWKGLSTSQLEEQVKTVYLTPKSGR